MASTVWRGFITFGLVTIPVRLFRAARAERVSLRRLYRAAPLEPADREKRPSLVSPAVTKSVPIASRRLESVPTLLPMQQASVQKGTEEVVPQESIVKGYEYEKGRFVAVEPEELKEIEPKTATEMEIEEFVQLSEIDPVYFETSYYVKPEDAGAKAYGLLYRSLQQTGLVAIAQFAMHAREHAVVLRPGKTGIIAHTMFYGSEVRAEEEYRADTKSVTPKELELAQTLIHSLSGSFEPGKYRDKYRERLESMLARKVQGQPVARVEKPQASADVVDITEALRKSLANLKKPASSDRSLRSGEGRPARSKKTRRAAQK